MIDPSPAVRMCGMAARHSHIGAVTFTRSVDSHVVVDMLAIAASPPSTAPATALFTRTVRPPIASTASATSPMHAFSVLRSAPRNTAPPPALDDLLDDGRAACRVPTVHDDARALGTELERDRLSDARGRSGDERELAAQAHAGGG